jgi:hypothetical protein
LKSYKENKKISIMIDDWDNNIDNNISSITSMKNSN